jgi:uncharacterized OsmC-like protein
MSATMESRSVGTAPARRQPVAMNGVDTPKLFATIAAVADQRALAKFQFRAKGRWLHGTHMRGTMEGFFGAGGEMRHKVSYTADADHPSVLCGEDNAPTPVEYLLHALAACLTAGVANIASARGVALRSVDCSIEGDIDLQGILGLSDEVRNGFQSVRATFRVDGDAPKETLDKIVAQAIARSAVFDVLAHGVPVTVATEA